MAVAFALASCASPAPRSPRFGPQDHGSAPNAALPAQTPAAIALPLNEPVDTAVGRLVLTAVNDVSFAPHPDLPEDMGGHYATATVELSGTPVELLECQSEWLDGTLLTLVELKVGAAPTALVHLQRATATRIGPPRVVRVEPGAEIALTRSLFLRFDGHRRDASRLIVDGSVFTRYTAADGATRDSAPSSVSFHLRPDRTPAAWRWRDWSFELVDYSYGRFMELAIARAQLETVVVSEP